MKARSPMEARCGGERGIGALVQPLPARHRSSLESARNDRVSAQIYC